MQEGKVKFFDNTKGYGFIQPSDQGEDLFVHKTGIIDPIQENDKVQFDVEPGRRGMQAVNVRKVTEE
mgnify:CR=1 FL=1|jgi:CspA family cold shock protein